MIPAGRRVSGSSDATISNCFRRMAEGDTDAVAPIWIHFFPRLLGLAKATMAGQRQTAYDPLDAVASALATFWKRAQRGEFGERKDRDELWNLLATITKRKALKAMEREQRLKRGGRCARYSLEEAAGAENFELQRVLERVPAQEFDVWCGDLFELLPDERLRSIALLRLLGHTIQEIADLQGSSLSAVERKMRRVRIIWRKAVEEDCIP